MADRYERTFSSRMRELRERNKLSQTALASMLVQYGVKIDGSAITRIEKNARVIRLGEALAIARVLGVPLPQMLKAAPSLREELGEAQEQLKQARIALETTTANHAAAMDRVERLMELLRRTGDGSGADLLSRIQQSKDQMTGVDRRVAEAILDTWQTISDKTISDIATEADSSETSVSRFCKAMGLEDYSQMQKLISEIAAHRTPIGYGPGVMEPGDDADGPVGNASEVGTPIFVAPDSSTPSSQQHRP